MELNVLEKIERDLIEKYSEKGDIILMGDFNARTGSEEDLIISDDTSHVPLSDNQYVIDTAVGKRSSHDPLVFRVSIFKKFYTFSYILFNEDS
jgi:endonuclease/exonuclease/phosphatase family metal-dependent hydrolase